MATKEVTGKSISGDGRKYTFNLVNAKDGTRIFHEYVSVIVQLLPDGTSFSNIGEGLALDIKQIVADLEAMLPFDRLEKLAGQLLGNGVVEMNGTAYNMGDDGFGDYALGDPLEVYTAILYAFKANFPKYIDPLFESLEANQGEQDSNSQTSATSPKK